MDINNDGVLEVYYAEFLKNCTSMYLEASGSRRRHADGAALRYGFGQALADVILPKMTKLYDEHDLDRTMIVLLAVNMLQQQWGCPQTRFFRTANFVMESMNVHCARAVKTVAARWMSGEVEVPEFTCREVDQIFINGTTNLFRSTDADEDLRTQLVVLLIASDLDGVVDERRYFGILERGQLVVKGEDQAAGTEQLQ